MRVDVLHSAHGSPRLDPVPEGAARGKGAQQTKAVPRDQVELSADSIPTIGDPGTPAERAAAAGFRSPSTVNALDRLERRLLANLEGPERAEAEQLLHEITQLAQGLAARENQPFGRSLEHTLKQLISAAARRHPVMPATQAPPSPSDPIPVDPAPVPTPETQPEVESSIDVLA